MIPCQLRVGLLVAISAGLLLASSFTVPQALGSTEWIGGIVDPGDWFEPTNWSAGVPDSFDNVFIRNGGTAQIASGLAESARLVLGSSVGSGSVVQSGGMLDASTIELVGRGRFTIETGQVNVSTRIELQNWLTDENVFDWLGGSITTPTFDSKSGRLNVGFDFSVNELADGTLMGGANMLSNLGHDLDIIGITRGATATHSGPSVSMFFLYVGDGGEGSYILSPDTELVVDRVIRVGADSKGTFRQLGGVVRTLNDVVGRIIVGAEVDSTGIYELVDGEIILTDDLQVGGRGAAEFHHRAGDVRADVLAVGLEGAAQGIYEVQSGNIRVRRFKIGNGTATGHFIQFGGTVLTGDRGVGDPLTMGSVGTLEESEPGAIYDLIDGTLDSTAAGEGSGIIELGLAGSALFRQSGGLVRASALEVGRRDTSGRTRYELSDGQIETASIFLGESRGQTAVASFVQIGGEVGPNNLVDSFSITIPNGKWHQSAGSVMVDTVQMGFNGNSSGDWEIAGGSLTASIVQVGDPGGFADSLGRFIVSGSEATVEIGDLLVGGPFGSGEFRIQDAGATIAVSSSLEFGPFATFSSENGTRIHMTGSDFINMSQDADALAGLESLTLLFEGGATRTDIFEVAGRDFGTTPSGLRKNFALSSLQIGGSDVGRLRLVNEFENQPSSSDPEALYVDRLLIGAGSFLDLNGINLYYRSAVIDANATIVLNGGSLAAVPEPQTVGLLIFCLLLCGLAGTRQGRRRMASDP